MLRTAWPFWGPQSFQRAHRRSLLSGSRCFLVTLAKPRLGPHLFPTGEARRERIGGWGGGCHNNQLQAEASLPGLVLHPSNGGFHGDGLLRDRGTFAPLSVLVRSCQKAEPSLGGSLGPLSTLSPPPHTQLWPLLSGCRSDAFSPLGCSLCDWSP